MEWNYYNTFIPVAQDCPAEYGTVPKGKKDGKTKPGVEFELAASHPYKYTQEELLFEVHIRHKGLCEEASTGNVTQMREQFYRKPQPCLRASMLPKKYGWGIHFNAEGKLALYAVESPEYRRFAEAADDSVRIVAAMRNSRLK
ncbi:DUF6157 family protein [Paenibacillus sp. NEAU-GSW1]|uniref:DUF6157 family protein n=1 Tax=Paenibacillus sp. NEAU-GSW1 TaxID=2682486 RepID=UPI0012E0D781|nr:DUF6157 family protein [Paenibacillus sp. NEAU-GSW1]MUT64582.1 hypothetical protein [Paenibacillus sp. NEAU-GSW1]